MNENYESLGSSEKGTYIAELEAVGLTLEDDPNSKESGRIFETNMSSWPPLDYGHIFGYSYHSPRFVYSQTAPILEVRSYPGGTLCLLKASVNLSQRTADKACQACVVMLYAG